MKTKLIDPTSLPVQDLWLHDDNCAGRPVRAVLVEDIKKAEAVEVPRWIPVTERLPDIAEKNGEEYCFVFVQDMQGKSGFFTTAVFYRDTQSWDLDFIRECTKPFPAYIVTHWLDMNKDIPDIPDAELLENIENIETTIPIRIKRGRITGVDNSDKYAAYFSYNTAEHCICCGEVIPEGRQVCPYCERQDKYV